MSMDIELSAQPRCPKCGRFMRRGLFYFMLHTHEECPNRNIYTYSPQNFDIEQFIKQLYPNENNNRKR
jgi:hypothetical protein